MTNMSGFLGEFLGTLILIVFGTGEGKRIYDYYNQSTRAISKIIAAIDDVLNDKLKTNKNRKERRAEKYTKKRRG